jgi:hypothetical protein
MKKTTTYVVLITPLDFFLWGVLKERGHHTPVLCRPKNFGRHCLSIKKKTNCNSYLIVIMITMNVIFWVVNFKTQNYLVISTTQNVYLRLSMYDCSNFVHSCRIFGISELQTVYIDCQNDKNRKWGYGS